MLKKRLKPAAILSLLVLVLSAATADSATLTRGPYLQMATPDSITIVWRTEGPSKPVVRFGDAPDKLSNAIDPVNIVTRVSADVNADRDFPLLYKEPMQQTVLRKGTTKDPDPSTAENTYQYEAQITGLSPDEMQFYAVYDGDTLLAGGDKSYHFETLPPVGTRSSQNIWVVGDSGTGGRPQKKVLSAMEAWNLETGKKLTQYLHVGDMAYVDGTDAEFQRNFFDIYDSVLRNIVCWPTMGNHEGHTSRGISGIGPYYDAYVVPTNAEAGGVPSGSEAYYSFDIGTIHFVCLDSYDIDRRPSGAMAQWLQADLDETDAEWLIAFWHHPPYTKGSHDSDREAQLRDMRTHIMPILETAGVDLVLTGHSHIYERSMLIDGAYHTPTHAEGVVLDDGDGSPDGDGAYRKSAGLNPHEGNVQIVTGHGGAGLSRRGTMPIMREIILEHGSVLLDFEGDTLTVRMVNLNQELRDLFSIVKRGEVTIQRIDEPWQPKRLPSELDNLTYDFYSDNVGNTPKGFTIVNGRNARVEVAKRVDKDEKYIQVEGKEDSMTPAFVVAEGFEDDQMELDVHFRIPNESSLPIATMIYGYRNPRNYFSLEVDAKKNTVTLFKIQSGKQSQIYKKKQKVMKDTWYEFEIKVNNDLVRIEFEDVNLFSKSVGTKEVRGQTGFRADSGATVHYRQVELAHE